MEMKVSIIAVVKKGNAVLMRKKPKGSPPYNETWYIFGGAFTPNCDIDEVIQTALKERTGIDVNITERLSWDTEVKEDLDGVTKQFVYLDALCEYVAGELVKPPDVEKLEWVPISQLKNYDLVPPSVKLFKCLGYI